jgi:hypothetical protein
LFLSIRQSVVCNGKPKEQWGLSFSRHGNEGYILLGKNMTHRAFCCAWSWECWVGYEKQEQTIDLRSHWWGCGSWVGFITMGLI